MKLEETAAGLEALGSPTRLAIYRLLIRAGLEGLAVGTIQAKTEVPRSTLSHHLHRLISVGLVAQERHGTTLICRANYRTMEQIIDFLTDECCVDDLGHCSWVCAVGASSAGIMLAVGRPFSRPDQTDMIAAPA